MIAQFLQKDNFFKKYMQLYAMRQAIANLEMEDDQTEILYPMRTQEMYNNISAFENIMNENPDRISPYDLINIANDVNMNLSFFDKGFRKTQVDVRKATKFFPPSARNVPSCIYSLFDSYHNIWINLPVFEKEARFHIELVRIQPFEDGNKRTARIITNFNLCKQNKSPVIISGKDTDKYFGYINDYNVNDFAKFLEEKSNEEFKIMTDLYQSICGGTFDNPLDNRSEEDVKLYHMAMRIIKDINNIPKI